MTFSPRFASLTRRALVAAAALATVAAAGTASAQTKTLYIGMNGGTMEKAYTQYVFPAFEKLHGAKVVVVPGTSSDILAKAQANKDKPQMHVMFLDDGIMVRAMAWACARSKSPTRTSMKFTLQPASRTTWPAA